MRREGQGKRRVNGGKNTGKREGKMEGIRERGSDN